MEQLLTLSQTIMALNKKEQMIFRAKFALRKCMPDKKFVHRKYKLIPQFTNADREGLSKPGRVSSIHKSGLFFPLQWFVPSHCNGLHLSIIMVCIFPL
jgi:hypothetical protein